MWCAWVQTKNDMMWKSTPLDTILDVDKIIAYWAPKGLIVHKASLALVGSQHQVGCRPPDCTPSLAPAAAVALSEVLWKGSEWSFLLLLSVH